MEQCPPVSSERGLAAKGAPARGRKNWNHSVSMSTVETSSSSPAFGSWDGGGCDYSPVGRCQRRGQEAERSPVRVRVHAQPVEEAHTDAANTNC